MRVLAVDPGGTTGFAEWRRDPAHFHAWHRPFDEAGAEMHRWLSFAEQTIGAEPYHVVCESFHISPQTAKKSPTGSLQAIELIGVARYMSRVYGAGFHLQSPSEAKMFSTDAKLRAMGWWTKGVDHPRDATRHLLLFLCKNNLVDLAALRRALDG